MNIQLVHAEAKLRSASRRGTLPPRRSPSRQQTLIVLSVCMALQMTSFVVILPLFARQFSELGAGVEALGASSMAYALAAMLAAPFMGAMADRFGRRRVVLMSLAAYVLAFTGYLLASSALAFIWLRALAGAFTAGLMPAVIGIVADLAPTDRRARWIGIVNGGASAGWILGPVLGGVLYDHWGYRVAVGTSVFMATLTFAIALIMVPETHKSLISPGSGKPSEPFDLKLSLQTFRNTLPHSLRAFGILLYLSFAAMFAWAFIEPRFMFYAYDDLGWSSSMLGLVMSSYGVAMTLGEFSLGQLSDRLGRKPVIVLGVVLFAAQFIGLAFFDNYLLIAASFVVAGLGNAMFDPALHAAILDIAPEEHRARVLALKSTAASLGNILGPALLILFTPFLAAQHVFLTATGIVCVSILFSRSVRTKPRSSTIELRKIAEKLTIDGKSTK